jgi:hypothetical protein
MKREWVLLLVLCYNLVRARYAVIETYNPNSEECDGNFGMASAYLEGACYLKRIYRCDSSQITMEFYEYDNCTSLDGNFCYLLFVGEFKQSITILILAVLISFSGTARIPHGCIPYPDTGVKMNSYCSESLPYASGTTIVNINLGGCTDPRMFVSTKTNECVAATPDSYSKYTCAGGSIEAVEYCDDPQCTQNCNDMTYEADVCVLGVKAECGSGSGSDTLHLSFLSLAILLIVSLF